MHLPLLHSLAPFLDLVAIFVVIGALIARLWIFVPRQRIAGEWPSALVQETTHDLLGRILPGALALLSFTSVLVLLVRTAEMGQRPILDAFTILPMVVQKTHFGAIWQVRSLALGILWLAWTASRTRAQIPSALAMFVCASVIAWSYSASGHAADRGDFTLQQWFDWLHVMAGALWAGSVLVTAHIMRKLQPWSALPNRHDAAAALTRLSQLATWALLAVLAGGGANAYQRLGAISDLWTTDYGLLLTGKLCLVAAMIGLGGLNRFYGLRRICASTGAGAAARQTDIAPLLRTFRARLRWEAGLALAVLLCVSVLIHSMPPMRPNPNLPSPPPHHSNLPTHKDPPTP